MRVVRSRLTGKPQALCEVRSQLAKMMQELEIIPKKTPTASRFIAVSSPAGKEAGMRSDVAIQRESAAGRRGNRCG
jgi:hypothetical protein